MMSYTRRHFLARGAAVATIGAIPRPLLASLGRRPEPVPPIEDSRLKALVDASLTAVTGAGASYADARLTHTVTRQIGGMVAQQEAMHFGVRALVDGYWGFAASPIWSSDEATRLGLAAVSQARANTLGQIRQTVLAPLSSVANGHWTMPVQDDPFAMHWDEIADFLDSLALFTREISSIDTVFSGSAEFVKQEKAFGSTAGQFVTQRLYRSSGSFGFRVRSNGGQMEAALDCLTPAGVGFELFRGQPLREYILQTVEATREDLGLPAIPMDVGRYDTVLDAHSMAKVLSETIGAATELDRALGYEANASGTSYINAPTEMVGTLKVGSAACNVTANRSEAGSVATVKWDDEGVEPDTFSLLQDGVLTDMQTDREGAGWLQDSYTRMRRPQRSHGCAVADTAGHLALTRTGNLAMQPGAEPLTFETLIASLEKGIAIKGMNIDMDFQKNGGLGMGKAYEVRRGKRTALLMNTGILFRARELWSSLQQCGGTGSRRRVGIKVTKGQPQQTAYHSVLAVPARFKELTVVDLARKA